jgi:hypothetical protein
MMDDMDPAAPSPSPDELEERARDVTNFGIDLKGDFPPEDAGLDLPESFAAFTVDFAIENALAFLHECETSQPRVSGITKSAKNTPSLSRFSGEDEVIIRSGSACSK